jgi:hypothetical protein
MSVLTGVGDADQHAHNDKDQSSAMRGRLYLVKRSEM